MSTNEVRRVFNEYGRFHHTEFYNDLKIVQKMPTGHVYVNIYTNAEGSLFALDVAGNPINNRMVQYTIYTNPYYHPYDGNIEGVFKIHSNFTHSSCSYRQKEFTNFFITMFFD